MAKAGSIPSHIIHLFIILLSYLPCILRNPTPLDLANRLRNDSISLQFASKDYGNIVHLVPSSVLYPSSIGDIMKLIKSSNTQNTPFTIAARGHGHSVRGQAMAQNGVVVDMASLRKRGIEIRVSKDNSLGHCNYYADVGGEQLLIDVLHATLKHGLAPVSLPDFLYLTVGGTLSNGGTGGEAFKHGPLINNVLELDVITGKGELITCRRYLNAELFFGVLGGLGQFGIITRARIVLDKAPTRAKWIRLVYSNFSRFSRDQEFLISSRTGSSYVEGFLIANENIIKEWKISFSSPSNQSYIASLLKKNGGLLYSIELAKFYDNQTAFSIGEEIHLLLKQLNFIPSLMFETDVSFFDFAYRVGKSDTAEGSNFAHPWLNLFIPKSRIQDFNDKVLLKTIPTLNHTNGIFLFYPFNHDKWDDRMSAMIPEEDIFYILDLLHASQPEDVRFYDKINRQILALCQENGIEVKQYLPNYSKKKDWMNHFGPKWNLFLRRKNMFDPKKILSPGQRIFN